MNIDTTELKNKKGNLFIGILIIFLVAVIVCGMFMLGDDFDSLLRWDLALFVLGIASLPLSNVLLGAIGKKGYYFGKVIGLALCAYLMWLFASVGIVRFGSASSIIFVAVYAAAVYLIAGFRGAFLGSRHKDGSDQTDIKGVFRRLFGEYTLEDIILKEIIFLFIIIFFSWFFGHKIPSTETERAMDYAFMQTLSKSSFMPPADLWAAGDSLNYYYFGLYIMTYLCKISFVDISIGYSLAMSLIITCCLIFCYSIVSGLLGMRKGTSDTVCTIGGIISAAAVTLCGNMHYFIFYKVVPTLWDVLQLKGDKPTYWFANSTRYIGYIPVNEADRTISEFPWYSFVIGDLHAHVIDIMYVLTIMTILICYVCKPFERDAEKDGFIRTKDIFDIRSIAMAVLLGIMAMINYWDYPIYYVVCGALILFSAVKRYGSHVRTYVNIAVQGIFFLAVAMLVKLPFTLNFDMMINGIKLATTHSLLHQLIVLWGLPVFTFAIFVIYLLIDRDKADDSFADTAAVLFGACATGLMLIPEVLFAADIYINGFPRCNTMFKYAYQAFIIFGLMMGYYIARVLFDRRRDDPVQPEVTDIERALKNRTVRNMMRISAVLLVITLGYCVTSSKMWYGKVKDWHYQGLDSTSSIKSALGEEIKAVEWIQENAQDQEVVLTAYGDSYSSACMMSVLTGHPTVLGWGTHEWLWHNDYSYVYERQLDIDQVYSGEDINAAMDIINKYGVRYIYVGEKENNKYGGVDIERLCRIGDIVYRDDNIASVIIKVR